MISYLRVIVLLLVVSFLILNCKKDEYKEINNLVLSDADIPPGHGHKFSMQDLLNNDETFIRLSNKFLKEDFPNKGSFLKNAQGDSLIITSDTINVVEKEDYKSYTIRVKRKGKNFDTENIVIENKKGKENAFIIGYKFDYNWIEEKVNGIETAPRGRIFFNNYNSSFLKTETCYTMTFTVTIPCGCGHTNPYVCNGCDTGEEYPDSYEYTGSYCVSGSDNETGAPFTTDSGTGGGGVGGGSPSPPSDSNDTSQTEMNLEDMTEFVELKLNRLVSKLSLNESQADWSSDNIAQALAIHDYCNSSRWSESAKNFGKEAVNALMNDGEVDFDEKLIFNPNIYDRLLRAMSSSEREIYDNELNSVEKYLYLKSATQAYTYAEIFYERPVRNRTGDAVKHSLWNALSTIRIGADLTKKLTDAHEDIQYDPNYPNHYKETEMDYFNNAIGRSIGVSQANQLGITILIEAARRDGVLNYLNNLEQASNGVFLATNNSVLVPTN